MMPASEATATDRWTIRFRSHPVFTVLDALEPLLRTLELQAGEDAVAESLPRTLTVITYLRQLLNAADPAIVSMSALGGLASVLEQAHSAVSSFIGSRNVGYFQQVDSYIDSALDYLAQPGIAAPGRAPEAFQDVANALRASYGEQLKKVLSDGGEVRAQLATLTQAMNELRHESSVLRDTNAQLVAALQRQFSEAQENRMSEFNMRMRDWEKEHQGKVMELQTDALSLTQTMLEDHNKLKVNLGHVAEDERSKFITHAQLASKELDRYRSEAAALVGAIGERGATSLYSKEANAAMVSRRLWNTLAIVCMAVLVVVTGTFLFASKPPGADVVLIRLSFALPIGVLFTYAARQAEKAHRREDDTRRTELELAAIGPYLEPLPDDVQVEFKKKMAERTFGREAQVSGVRPGRELALADLFASPELLALLAEALKLQKKDPKK